MKIFSLLLFLLISSILNGQKLNSIKLSFDDKKKGITQIFQYSEKDSYGQIQLKLYKNGGYVYTLNTFNKDLVGTGKWTKTNDVLTLTSDLINDNLPMKLFYNMDSSDVINECKIGIVQNLKGNKMTDAIVLINNDSTQCTPFIGFCYWKPNTFDSIKVIFENGMKSKWVKVEKKKYVQIVPVIQTELLVSSYLPFKNKKFKIEKDFLTPFD